MPTAFGLESLTRNALSAQGIEAIDGFISILRNIAQSDVPAYLSPPSTGNGRSKRLAQSWRTSAKHSGLDDSEGRASRHALPVTRR